MDNVLLLDRVRLRTGSDLPDDELLAMIDGIAAELDARFGAAGPITVQLGDALDAVSRQRATLRLMRPADPAEPMVIIEREPGNTAEPAAAITLAPDDYRLLHGGHTLQRLTGGPNPHQFWAPLVEVTYTPVGLVAAREEVTIKLIQLDLSYRGALRSERAGDYQFTLSGDITADREAILRSLQDRRGMVMA